MEKSLHKAANEKNLEFIKKIMAAKRQVYKARQDESLGARRGARKSLKNKVSKAGRRAMASGPRSAAGGKKYGLTPKKKR